MKNGIGPMVIEHMHLGQIADSGQCFTWRKVSEDIYRIEAFGLCLEVRQIGQEFFFSCSQQEFDQIWRGYFDLERDYGALKRSIDPEDRYLNEAVVYGSGIRVLRQELWEVMVSFLISQNNNIPRIRNSIRQLQQRYGSLVFEGDTEGEGCYTFPGPDALAKASADEFAAAGLGYRARYLYLLAQEMKDGGLQMLKEELEHMGDEESRQRLMSFCGIGRKVADCICLFGLNRTGMFPIDTHIRKILRDHYDEEFPYERYPKDLGILQQYMFYYDLKR